MLQKWDYLFLISHTGITALKTDYLVFLKPPWQTRWVRVVISLLTWRGSWLSLKPLSRAKRCFPIILLFFALVISCRTHGLGLLFHSTYFIEYIVFMFVKWKNKKNTNTKILKEILKGAPMTRTNRHLRRSKKKSCKFFTQFVQKTLINRIKCGAISIVGKVGVAYPPHIVPPLTVEPTWPRLCHDARYLNLWMCDMPFSLDFVSDLPRYVQKDTYQTVLDDKSGYDHILLTEESRTFFGIQWGGWYFTYNTLPFEWKTSPYVYHTTGLLASILFRSIGIPCSLYIDDRHSGELQVPLDKGEHCTIDNSDARYRAAAELAVFLVTYHLVRLGYFLGLAKPVLVPTQTVPFLGFLSDSAREVLHLRPKKRQSFLALVKDVLGKPFVTVKTLQRLAGKCVSFSLVVPAAKLFTREMNAAISRGQRINANHTKPLPLTGKLKGEIEHWLFLEGWDDPLPWREERHVRVVIASDASNSGWGGSILAPFSGQVSDYWTEDQPHLEISTKEAIAMDKVLTSFAQ